METVKVDKRIFSWSCIEESLIREDSRRTLMFCSTTHAATRALIISTFTHFHQLDIALVFVYLFVFHFVGRQTLGSIVEISKLFDFSEFSRMGICNENSAQLT